MQHLASSDDDLDASYLELDKNAESIPEKSQEKEKPGNGDHDSEKRKSIIADVEILVPDDGSKVAPDENDASPKNGNGKVSSDDDDENVVPPALPPRPPRPRQTFSCTCSCDCGIDDGPMRHRFQRSKLAL